MHQCLGLAPQVLPAERQKSIYTGILLSGKLNAHLEEINRSTSDMLIQLVEQMAKRESIAETRKTSDQMAQISVMQNIQNRAEEVVLSELLYG